MSEIDAQPRRGHGFARRCFRRFANGSRRAVPESAYLKRVLLDVF